jgi:hypothetical protein
LIYDNRPRSLTITNKEFKPKTTPRPDPFPNKTKAYSLCLSNIQVLYNSEFSQLFKIGWRTKDGHYFTEWSNFQDVKYE